MNVLQHRGKVVELALLQAGYTLSDIRGSTRYRRSEEPPRGVARAVNAVTGRTAAICIAGLLTTSIAIGYETGLYSPAVATLVLGALLCFLSFVEFNPTITKEVERQPGMDQEEVQERLVQWKEWQRLRRKKEKEEANSATAQAPTPGRTH